MTIIVFLLDTSASMNQRVFLGGRPTLLDVAKSAVETFVKVRQRSPDSRGDRYMLLTFEEPPSNIKAGWKENLGTFMSELKNLQATGLTTLGHALRHTFDVLNVNRMQHGIDNYGQGRCPYYLEPSIIVAITDGGQLSSNSGVQEELKMQGSSPGCELTREPFRWDQRLFSLVLRMSGQPAGDRETGLVPSDSSPIDLMCEVTGGRSYSITSHRMLHQCIDSLVQKVQAGVVIHFEKFGADPIVIPNTKEDEESEERKMGWHNSRKMIYVPRVNQKNYPGGFWPIPEAFWPDPSITTLPPRSAHPQVRFMCGNSEPLTLENLPFDKYELEPSPLTQFILARKQPNICWQVFVPNSGKNANFTPPFGYLKASTNLTCVNLFVMPFNYPALLPLLDDLFRLYRLKPPNEWRAKFGMYLADMPPYYSGPLKRALIRMGAGNYSTDIREENNLSYQVINYLKKIRNQARMEYDRTCNEVGSRAKASEPKRNVTSFKNPFDVPRHQLLDHLTRLRTQFLRPSQISAAQHEALHNMPVGQMGNYQEYLKRMPNPLREIESTPVRQHMFGNPFKIDKRMIIDEADIDLIGGTASTKKKEASTNNNSTPPPPTPPPPPPTPPPMPMSLPRSLKRKSGPLSKDYVFVPRRARMTPCSSPCPSPLREIQHEEPLSKLPLLPLLPPIDGPYANVFESLDNFRLASPPHIPSLPTIPQLPSPQGMEMIQEFQFPTPPEQMDVSYSPEIIKPSSPPHSPNNDFPMASMSMITSMPMNPFINSQLSPMSVITELAGMRELVTPIEEKPYPIIIQNGEIDSIQNFSEPNLPGNANYSPSGPSPMINDSINSNHIYDVPEISINNNGVVHNHIKSLSKSKEPPDEIEIEKENPPAIEHQVDDESTRIQNVALRARLCREIRRPILRIEILLDHLSEIVGSFDTKVHFLKALEKEAIRFKRKRLAKIFEDKAEALRTSMSLRH